ncbi:hypothetical protein GLOIN_2v1627559 [Rhizophagus clarus]|nr:hypothetical protein GLOIN_2v1627559 [Rhizophagus clarus]
MQISTDDSIASIKKSTEILLKNAEMWDSESRHGIYDYTKIINEFCEKIEINQGNDDWICGTGPRLAHADFLIDDIEIHPAKKRGRSWVAKRDIPEGTLLMVSKAFEIVYGNEVPLSYKSIDFTSKTSNTATHSELATRIAQKLLAEPDLCQEVYELYAGPDMEILSEDLSCSVDVRRIEKIIKYNYFEALEQQWNDIWSAKENSRLTKDRGAGLWILPSYFSHSCVDVNAERLIIGDMMFIRSCRPISSGSELTFNYCSPMGSYEERSYALRLFGINNCSCRLCNLDRSESKKTKLRQASILETYVNSLEPRMKLSSNFNPSLIKELIKLINELKELRREHPDLEFQSFELKSDLVAAYVRTGNIKRSLPILKEIYNFAKTTQLSQFTSDTAYKIASHYAILGQMKEAKEWWDVALKELAEHISGKFNEGGTEWRNKALQLAEKLSPKIVSDAKNKRFL